MTIWKYELKTIDEQTIDMPFDAKALCVDVQYGKPCMWAMVNPSRPKVARRVWIRGTGHDFEEPVGTYIGSFQLLDGRFVGHVFIAD